MSQPLELEPPAREALWEKVVSMIEEYLRDLPSLRVSPPTDPAIVREMLRCVDF